MDNLIWFIVICIVAGFLAGRLTKGKGFGLLANLIIGVGGAFLGTWLFGVLGIEVLTQNGNSRIQKVII